MITTSRIFRSLPLLFAALLWTAGCNQNSTTTPEADSRTNTPPPQAMTPPPSAPHQLTLYMVPLNPGEFSMDTIQANKRTVEKEPGNVPALVSLGDANFMIQRFEAAQDYYEKALKADKKQINARISLANAYLFMRKPEESVKQLDLLLTLQKDHPEALFNKGLILLQSMGDSNGAKQSWNRLIQSSPDHQLAKEVKAELDKM